MSCDKSKLDLSALRIFLEVYRTGSITAAADKLDMTQPGVSTAIKRLQNQIGAALFVRQGRSITPTQKGINFAEQLKQSIYLLDDAVDSLSEFTPAQHRTFKVLVNEAMLNILHPAIERDNELENITIELHPIPISEELLEEQLSLSQFDLAIDIYVPQNKAFMSELLIEDHCVVACRQDHPRIHDHINEAQFYAEKHIIMMMERGSMSLAQRFTKSYIPTRDISSVSDSLLGALHLASMSDCLCTSSYLLGQQVEHRLGIKLLPYPLDSISINHTMIWHRRDSNSDAGIWLRDKIKHYIASAKH